VKQEQPTWRRVVRTLAVPALALAVIAFTPLAPASSATVAKSARWTPLTPVRVSFDQATHPSTVTANLLAFNDFHGNIDPPTGSSGVVNGIPAGGVEYLAYWVKQLRAQAKQSTPYVFTVSAGDNIGASPLISAAFHDEPAIEELNSLGLDLSSVGNHEFDEGVTELKRMQFGGCHPVDGCQDGDGFAGADFPYLAANVTDKQTKLPILLPVVVKLVGTVPVAFVGMTLHDTPTIVNPAGITTVDFKDEVETAKLYRNLLNIVGIHSLVLVIHEGGAQVFTAPGPDPNSCAGFTGAIGPIVAGLPSEYGVVVSAHTHQWYSCALPNSSGANSVVTSAGSFGRLVTSISMTIDTHTKRFVSVEAHNTIAVNGIQNPDGTFQKDAAGNFVRDPAKVDPAAKVIADKYRVAIAPVANRIVGSITADIPQAAAPSGESPLGDVIGDAQLAYTAASAGAQIALMNPGGIRTSLSFANSPGGEAPGQVTYGECFAVQPFNNLVVTQTFTGAQLKNVLEQQFPGFGGQTVQRILQPSASLTYSYSPSRPLGDRVFNLALNGTPIDPAANYQVTTNDFLANGGDGFTNLKAGTNRITAPGFDVDALVAYIGAHSPVAPGPVNRITLVP
jgi:5'-nucleotidase